MKLDTAQNPRLLAALRYAEEGWACFPCKPKEKRPATRHGFKEATTETARLIHWWARMPWANVAVATGRVSNLVVLDVDPRNGGEASLHEHERKYGPLPDTIKAATGGGGWHYFFEYPEGANVQSGILADGLDVKADGGYVIAPPSAHPEGTAYRWENDLNSFELAPCPPWVTPAPKKRKADSEDESPDAAKSPLGQAFRNLGMLG